MADGLRTRPTISVRLATWYTKERPTFAEAMALTRQCLWRSRHFSTSSQSRDVLKVPRSLLERFTDVVCYATCMAKVELRNGGVCAHRISEDQLH
jgi:hypothetical protein